MTTLIPTYYLVHETPAGTRYAYPRPAQPQGIGSWPGAAGTWMSPDADTVIVPVPDGSYRSTQAWIVSDRPLSTLALPWREPLAPGDWIKTATAPDDPIAEQAWAAWPERPSVDVMAHWTAADDDERHNGRCGTCSTFRAVYKREERWAEHRHEVDVTAWLPLPGVADAHSNTAWLVADTSRTVLYGAHTNHLWPGEIPGFRDAVNRALKDDPRTSYVFTHDSADRPRGSTEVTVPIRWETPKVERRHRTGFDGRKLRGTEDVPRPIATSHKATRIVPAGLAAATKAEAVAAWDAAVTAEVEAFMPPALRACNHCDGHGFVFAGGAS